jgi:DnaJ-class molecular chaperone
VLALALLLIGGGGTGSWWYVNTRLKPTRPCKPCEGTGYRPIRFSHGKYRRCAACEGRGKVLTWAARQRMNRAGRGTR